MIKRALIYFLLLIFQGALLVSALDRPGKASCEPYIIITGSTNVNSFQFHQIPERIAPILLTSLKDGGNSFISRTRIKIPVKRFKADNPFIYKDFMDLLKAAEHPYITVDLPKPFESSLQSDSGKFDIRITIAGISKEYKANCFSDVCDDGNTFLFGTQIVRLSDFNIDPPEKTFGLIKVKDEVIINFGFAFAQ
jgi:hypothetical protein